jgi:NAD+ synthase (glutamine-hydrolysing)
VVHLVDGNEYKRRQSPPGIKVTARAFGRDRRLPISQGFRRNSQPKQKPARTESPRKRAQRG